MNRGTSTQRSDSASRWASFDAQRYARVMAAYRLAPPQDLAQRWLLLEAAHVVGQTRLVPHTRVHLLMLSLGWETRNWAELAGQVLRLCLVPLGHWLGRLPLGNPGSARVSAFAAQPVSPEIREILAGCRRP